jgi:Conserved protein/domain typically associated with flavoprotein oxygenases, DIM6/NTAB family
VIAWVTGVPEAGIVNAAPYSFFNLVGITPPLVALGLLKEARTRNFKISSSPIPGSSISTRRA